MIVLDILIAVFLLAGGVFTLVGSIGLIKLDNPMSRLHGPTKASTLGVGSLLLASIVYWFTYGDGSAHEALVMAFLFCTAPITGNFISKVHLHRLKDKPDFASPPQKDIWVTYAEK